MSSEYMSSEYMSMKYRSREHTGVNQEEIVK
jgi:hypothetical protein